MSHVSSVLPGLSYNEDVTETSLATHPGKGRDVYFWMNGRVVVAVEERATEKIQQAEAELQQKTSTSKYLTTPRDYTHLPIHRLQQGIL